MLEESEWQKAKCPEEDKHKKRKNKNSRGKTTKITPEHETTQVSPTDGLKRNISDRSLSRDVPPVKDDNQLPDEGGNIIAQRKKQKFKLVRQKLSIVE